MIKTKKVLYSIVLMAYLTLGHDSSTFEIMLVFTLGLIYMELMDKL